MTDTDISFEVDTSEGYPVERVFDSDGEVWLRAQHVVGWLLWVADNWEKAAELDDPDMSPTLCRAVAVGLRSTAKHCTSVFDGDDESRLSRGPQSPELDTETD